MEMNTGARAAWANMRMAYKKQITDFRRRYRFYLKIKNNVTIEPFPLLFRPSLELPHPLFTFRSLFCGPRRLHVQISNGIIETFEGREKERRATAEKNPVWHILN